MLLSRGQWLREVYQRSGLSMHVHIAMLPPKCQIQLSCFSVIQHWIKWPHFPPCGADLQSGNLSWLIKLQTSDFILSWTQILFRSFVKRLQLNSIQTVLSGSQLGKAKKSRTCFTPSIKTVKVALRLPLNSSSLRVFNTLIHWSVQCEVDSWMGSCSVCIIEPLWMYKHVQPRLFTLRKRQTLQANQGEMLITWQRERSLKW